MTDNIQFYSTYIVVLAIGMLISAYWLKKNKRIPDHHNKALNLISKCYRILENESQRISLEYNKELTKQCYEEIEEDFKELLAIPEIVSDVKLFRLLQNAENRALYVIGLAHSICHDPIKLQKAYSVGNTNIISIDMYYKESKEFIDDFDTVKDKIFKYCKFKPSNN